MDWLQHLITDNKIPVGEWARIFVDWLTTNYEWFFDGLSNGLRIPIEGLVAWLEERGELDRTLVLVLSDNGASSEGGPFGSLNDVRTWNMLGTTIEEAGARLDEIGGPRIHNNYPWGWTVAGNIQLVTLSLVGAAIALLLRPDQMSRPVKRAA